MRLSWLDCPSGLVGLRMCLRPPALPGAPRRGAAELSRMASCRCSSRLQSRTPAGCSWPGHAARGTARCPGLSGWQWRALPFVFC